MRLKFLLISILLLQFYTPVYSQSTPDEAVEPRPYIMFPYFEKAVEGKGVKRSVLINEFDLFMKINRDTAYDNYFDKKGQKIKSIRYTEGYRYSVTTFENLPEKKTWQWHEKLKSGTIHLSKTIYYSTAKPWFFYKATIVKGDTLSTESATFKYDSLRRLIQKEVYYKKKLGLKKLFIYNNTDLVRVETYNYSTNPTGQTFNCVEYTFNTDHLPIEKRAFIVKDGNMGSYVYNRYTYKGKQLVMEKYNKADDPGKEVTVKYTYDTNQLPLTIVSTQDTLYRQIHYTFNNKLLSKISVKTNTWNKLDRDVIIYNVNSRTSIPIIYEEDFVYDKHGNLVKTSKIVNGKLENSRSYTLQYY